MNPKLEAIHQRAVGAGENFQKAETEVFAALCEVDENKVFQYLEFTSLYNYAMKAMKLSDACASNAVTVVRKSKSVPELKEAVLSGELKIATARKITPVLTPENASEWIEKAKTLTKAKLEQAVATEKPETATKEKARYISKHRLELTLGMQEEVFQKLKRAQDLESQRTRTAATFEMTIAAALEFYLQKKDPLLKAKSNATASVRDGSRAVPAALEREILQRDVGQCTHIHPDGERCSNRRWLELHHHEVPFSKGGKHTLENLRTLCAAHHRQAHMH